MNHRKQVRETEKVVQRVMKKMAKFDKIGKSEFEEILQKIIEHVHKNTGIAETQIGQATGTVMDDLPNEYGQLSEDQKSWEAMIGYLYAKYLQVLGAIE